MVEIIQLHANIVGALSSFALARPYAEQLAQVALELRPPELATRFAWLHTSILYRESGLGLADTLQPKGLTGRGDWTPRARTAAWASARPWIEVRGPVLDKHTGAQRVTSDGQLLYWVLPAAGGWGVGLGQLDEEAHHDLVAMMLNGRPAWQDLAWHLRATGRILADGLDAFPGDERGGLDSYNAGKKRVREAELAGLDPDSVTTGSNYGAYVLAHADKWSAAQ